jgi:hypothetical protein
MNAWKLAACVIGLSPLLAKAEVPSPLSTEELAAAGTISSVQSNPTTAPTTAPATPQQANDPRPTGFAPDFRPGMGMGIGRGMGMGYGQFGRVMSRLGPMEPPTQAEWEESLPFLKEHSPKRLEAINNMPDERRSKWRLMGFLAKQYQNIQRIKQDDGELAQIVTNRMELEDAVYGLVAQFRDAKRGGETGKQAEMRREIHQKVTELVDTNIKERRERIARLQRTLKQESERLADDEKSRDSLVDKRVQSLIDGQPAVDDGRGQADQPPAAAEQVGSAAQP